MPVNKKKRRADQNKQSRGEVATSPKPTQAQRDHDAIYACKRRADNIERVRKAPASASPEDYVRAADQFRSFCASNTRLTAFKKAWCAFDAKGRPNDGKMYQTRCLRASCKRAWCSEHTAHRAEPTGQEEIPRGGRRVARRAAFYCNVDSRRQRESNRARRTAAATEALKDVIAAGRPKGHDETRSQLGAVRRIAGDRVYFSRSFQKRVCALL